MIHREECALGTGELPTTRALLGSVSDSRAPGIGNSAPLGPKWKPGRSVLTPTGWCAGDVNEQDTWALSELALALQGRLPLAYREIPPFTDGAFTCHWMEKKLG